MRAELKAARRVLDERRMRHENDLASGRNESESLQAELLALRQALETQRAEGDAARARAKELAGRLSAAERGLAGAEAARPGGHFPATSREQRPEPAEHAPAAPPAAEPQAPRRSRRRSQ